MAPFKLKFRMGSSRSTSQEHEPDPQVNEALLNHQTNATIGASSSTIDSVDCNSLVSLNTSERKLLLPHKGNNMRMGFINQNQTAQGESIPNTPPPTYEHVLEEQRQLAIAGILCNDDPLTHLNELEQLSLNELPCTDPNCQENYTALSSSNSNNSNGNGNGIHQPNNNIINNNEISITITNTNNQHDTINLNNDHLGNEQQQDEAEENTETLDDDRKESIDSQELLLGENMTDSSTDQERREQHHHQQQQQQQQQQQMLDNTSCSGNCQQYGGVGGADVAASCSGVGMSHGELHSQNSDFYDPLMNHGVYCNDASHYEDDYHQQMYEQDMDECPGNTGECLGSPGECNCNSGEDVGACSHWEDMQQQQANSSHQSLQCDSDEQYQQHQQQQQQQYQQQQQQYYQQQLERSLTPEIISNKSSKEIYKDLAKQCGITCKMSDGCRCMECQSHYFDCEYDDVGGDLNLNEQQKTDGGLGAGTPMFITEVMHGSACNIL